MSFHKRKKKQVNSSAVVLSSTPDNPISFPALPGYSVSEEKDQTGQLLTTSHPSDSSNGVAKMTCDNNNKNGANVVASHENGQDRKMPPHQVDAADHDLKSQVANHSDSSQHPVVSHKTSTSSSSSSAKRKFIVLSRLFKPWKWKRKKKSDKTVKGKLEKFERIDKERV